MSTKTSFAIALLAAASLMAGTVFAQEPTLDQVYQAAESGNFTQAQRMMDEVLRTHPSSAKAHFVEAELLAKQGRLAAAEAELNTAERLEPGLPFARPQAVQELKRRVASSRGLDSPGRGVMTPAAPAAHAAGGGISWTMVLFGIGLVALVFVVVGAIRRRASAYPASASGVGYPTAAPVPPYGGGAAGTPMAGGGGIGSGILGGLATGAALGAGVVAGEALAHRLGGGFGGGSATPAPGEVAPPVADDMGGNDFGVADNSSWDDNMLGGGGGGGGGGDWT